MNKKKPQTENALYLVFYPRPIVDLLKRMFLISLLSYQHQQSSPYSYKPYSDRQPPLP